MLSHPQETRQQTILKWLNDIVKQAPLELQPLSGDASLRCYYRLSTPTQSLVVMDSKNDPSVLQFVTIQRILAEHGILTPHILSFDEKERLLLLDDFGDELFLPQLNDVSADALYKSAIETLIQIQTIPSSKISKLPIFDEAFLESQWLLFTEWFLAKHLDIKLTKDQQEALETCKAYIHQVIQSLPSCLVHLDYHSRNLMCLPNQQTGVLDFQDARLGPVAYDVASLFNDAYIKWPKAQVEQWLKLYFTKAKDVGVPLPEDFMTFHRQFITVALQRHLKNLGIFSRLNYRDNKPGYLNDIPMLLGYIAEITKQEKAFAPMSQFFQNQVMPAMAAKAPQSKAV